MMNQQSGGGRNLFIDFGAAVPCFDDGLDDCVTDARPVVVDCPFPSDLRTTQTGVAAPNSCSALVRSTLSESTAFDLDGSGAEEYIQDMNPGVPCPADNPADNCGGTVRRVRSITKAEWDIQFRVNRPNGNKVTNWFITFSNLPSGHCDPGMPLEFLSIRALDMVDGVGGISGADTWKIGTFDENGNDDPRIACLSKAKGGGPDEFVGFFRMSFMYTIEIKPEDE